MFTLIFYKLNEKAHSRCYLGIVESGFAQTHQENHLQTFNSQSLVHTHTHTQSEDALWFAIWTYQRWVTQPGRNPLTSVSTLPLYIPFESCSWNPAPSISSDLNIYDHGSWMPHNKNDWSCITVSFEVAFWRHQCLFYKSQTNHYIKRWGQGRCSSQ